MKMGTTRSVYPYDAAARRALQSASGDVAQRCGKRTMDKSDPKFPELPGWRFSLMEVSMCVYQAEGRHVDGRSVSRMGHDSPTLIREKIEDARSLPERRKTCNAGAV